MVVESVAEDLDLHLYLVASVTTVWTLSRIVLAYLSPLVSYLHQTQM
jgi:hypothetical protein